MATLRYYNRVFNVQDGQSVLDVLQANGQDIPFSCKMGVCVTCVMQVVAGKVPPEAQKGLRDNMIARGHFLPCVCKPSSDLEIAAIDTDEIFSPAVVSRIEHPHADICQIFLQTATPLYYRPGQFLNLRRDDGLVRSYSLASVPRLDSLLELHVKRLNQGAMSNWLVGKLSVGDKLSIQGPFGNCCYQQGEAERNLLLIGSGTGLAPLIGIARDAFNSGHSAPVWLYHGSQNHDELYLRDVLRDLERNHSLFHYVPCVSHEAPKAGIRQGRADAVAFGDHRDLSDWHIYLCGHPPMIHAASEQALHLGANIEGIFKDPYELKDLRKSPRSESPEHRETK